MHVHRQEAVGAGDADEVGEEPRGDRDPRLVLLVAPPVRELRHDRRDPARGGALERIDHDEKLHDRVAHRRSDERLDDEHVVLAGVLVDLHEDLVVRELEDIGLAERDLELAADVAREGGVGVARVDGKAPEHGSPSWRVSRKRKCTRYRWGQ